MSTLDLFRHETNTESHSAGTTIFEQGSEGAAMFVVVDGTVDLTVDGHVVETVEPGGIFGEMALVDHGARSASALAKSDVKLAPIDRKRFLFLVENAPHFAIDVMQIMASRLRRHNVAQH